MEVILCDDLGWLLSEEAFSLYSLCMHQPAYEEYKLQMKRFDSDPFVKVFVCRQNDEAIGIMSLDRSDAVPGIVGIAVPERYRRQGIGRHMIQRIMDLERLDRIKAQTDDDAIGFYRQCGFADEQVIKEYPDGQSVRYNCVLDIMKMKRL